MQGRRGLTPGQAIAARSTEDFAFALAVVGLSGARPKDGIRLALRVARGALVESSLDDARDAHALLDRVERLLKVSPQEIAAAFARKRFEDASGKPAEIPHRVR